MLDHIYTKPVHIQNTYFSVLSFLNTSEYVET